MSDFTRSELGLPSLAIFSTARAHLLNKINSVIFDEALSLNHCIDISQICQPEHSGSHYADDCWELNR